MKGQKRAILLHYLIHFALAIGVTMGILLIKGVQEKTSKELLQTLHDAFFATGAFCLLYAGLRFAGGAGAFLGVGYAVRWAVQALMPFLKKRKQTYGQYCEEKSAGKPNAHSKITARIGIVFILTSLVFLYLWGKG